MIMIVVLLIIIACCLLFGGDKTKDGLKGIIGLIVILGLIGMFMNSCG